MAGGTKNSPKDSTTSLGREEEKDSYKERKNTSNEVRGEVRLDKADAVIDGNDRRGEQVKIRTLENQIMRHPFTLLRSAFQSSDVR